MFDRVKSLFARKPAASDPYRQFVAVLLNECRRQGRKPLSYDHEARSVVFGDGNGRSTTVHLDGIFTDWAARNGRLGPGELAGFVRGIGATAAAGTATVDAAQLKTELMPVLRRRAEISNVLIENRMRRGWEIASAPLCGDLAACVCRDGADAMGPLARSQLDGAKLSGERALAFAMARFRVRAPAPEFEALEGAGGVFLCRNLKDYQSSLLLMTPGQDFVFPPLEGAPVVLVPGRSSLFVTGSGNGPGLQVLLEFARVAEHEPDFLSSALWVFGDGGWREHGFDDGTAEAVKTRRIARDRLASDYRVQKELLDNMHRTQSADVFVADFMIYGKRHDRDSEFSVAVLPSGARAVLLPVADRVAFVEQIVDPRTGVARSLRGDVVHVAWGEAMAIAGHLFEPVADLYPPRYRAGFPDPGTWSALKAASVAR